MKLIDRVKNNRWLIPLALFWVVFITYGYQLSRMGFYSDDWEIIYLNHFNNPAVFWNYFLNSNSLANWIYSLLSPVIGMSPMAWQIVSILMRWAGLVGFWWALRMVWPKRSFEIGWVCLLLAVYPAFSRQSMAVTYSRHFACFAFFAVSLGLNLLALDNKRWWWLLTITGAFASLLQLITLEYFIGLELLRPLFLWIRLKQHGENWKKSLRELILQWLPYLLVLLIYTGCRFYWDPLTSHNTVTTTPVLLQGIAQNPAGEIIKLANQMLKNLVHLTVDNWLAPLDSNEFDLRAKANWLSWGAAGMITLICAWLLIKTRKNDPEDGSEKDHFSREALIIGLTGMLAVGNPGDQFAPGSMFGAVLFIVGAVYWFSRRRLQQTIILGVVFAFALSSQMQTVNKYRLSRDTQNDFYWQLAWRAPAIKPGTAVLGTGIPFDLANDLHIAFAMNTIYDQGGKSFEAPLWYFQADSITGKLVPALKPGNPIDYNYQSAHFNGTTDQVLVAEYSYGTSCLHIITTDDSQRTGLISDDVILFKLSKPELIDLHTANASTPPVSIFGPEPKHGWCYAYQQIDSARQEQNWPEAVRLYEEADSEGLKPKSAFEYVPVIQAYQRLDLPEKALAASLKAQELDKDQTTYFCSLWKNTPVYGSEDWPKKANAALKCDEAAGGKQP